MRRDHPVIPARLLAAVAASAAALGTVAGPASAAPDPLRVRDAAVLPAPPGASTASVHLTVANTGRSDDQLQAVTSPDAARVEVHAMDMTGGVMRMRPVPGPLRVPAGGVLDLSSASGRHLMLVGLRRPLRPGGRAHLVLRFAHRGAVAVDAPVQGPRP